jgi:N utilization substance protein A
MRIKLKGDEIRYIALFESITGATVNDCLIDDNFERVIFVMKPGEMGRAIGKDGRNISMLRKMTGRPVEVVEQAEDVEGLVRNSLTPARVKQIRVTERGDKKIVVVEVDPRDKAIAIGKNGRTINRARMLAKRYFQIDHVQIT